MTLLAEHISVSFGGLHALTDVSVEVEPGQVVGMVGPNGAGKSTLFNCITGVVIPQSGRIAIDGVDVTNARPDIRVRHGIGRSFQTPRIDIEASVIDVVALGFYPRTKQSALSAFLYLPSVRRQETVIHEKAAALINKIGISAALNTRSGDLSLGQLRQLEVARALATGASYLLLDECAAGVDESDRLNLSTTIRQAADEGLGVLLVEHDFGWLKATSDALIVLVQGTELARGDPVSVAADPRVIAAYLGDHDDD